MDYKTNNRQLNLLYRSSFLYHFFKYLKYLKNGNIYVKNPNIDVILICGLNRSGSTLLYNLVYEIIKFNNNELKGFFYDYQDFKQSLNLFNNYKVIKTHEYEYEFNFLLKNGWRGYFTSRNILDILASHIQKGWILDLDSFLDSNTIDRWVSKSKLYLNNSNVKFVKYEDMISDKKLLIKKISNDLSVKLSANQILEIDNLTAVDSMNLSQNLDENLLHKNHINSPNLGKWKEIFTDEQARKILSFQSVNRYNTLFGYSMHFYNKIIQ